MGKLSDLGKAAKGLAFEIENLRRNHHENHRQLVKAEAAGRELKAFHQDAVSLTDEIAALKADGKLPKSWSTDWPSSRLIGMPPEHRALAESKSLRHRVIQKGIERWTEPAMAYQGLPQEEERLNALGLAKKAKLAEIKTEIKRVEAERAEEQARREGAKEQYAEKGAEAMVDGVLSRLDQSHRRGDSHTRKGPRVKKVEVPKKGKKEKGGKGARKRQALQEANARG